MVFEPFVLFRPAAVWAEEIDDMVSAGLLTVQFLNFFLYKIAFSCPKGPAFT